MSNVTYGIANCMGCQQRRPAVLLNATPRRRVVMRDHFYQGKRCMNGQNQWNGNGFQKTRPRERRKKRKKRN